MANGINQRNAGRMGVSNVRSSAASYSAVSSRNSGINPSMSRGGFVKTAGVTMAGLGAAATGLGGVARAHVPDADNIHVISPDYIEVYPLNTSPDDFQHVQWAVSNVVSGGTVVLKEGTFNFGATRLDITRSITLQGDGKGPDGKPAAKITGTATRIIRVMNGPAATVRNLWIQPGWLPRPYTSNWVAVAIYNCYSANTVTIEENYIEVDMTGFEFWGSNGYPDAILSLYNNCLVNILNNYVKVTNPPAFGSCMNLYHWSGNAPAPTTPGQPTLIKGNILEMACSPGNPSYMIRLGVSNGGLDNATAVDNILKGTTGAGIVRFPYVSTSDGTYGGTPLGNTVISNNNLSGLTAWYSQIWIMASNTTCTQNTLGPVVVNRLGYEWPAGGIILENINWHPPWGTQPTYTQNCYIANNDYRLTGLPGWSFDDDLAVCPPSADPATNCGGVKTYGCIAIGTFAELISPVPVPPLYEEKGLGCHNNVIAESGKFPVGTGGARTQVWSVESSLSYNNRVIGLPAHDIHTTPRGIGQNIQASNDFIAAIQRQYQNLSAIEPE